MNQLTNINTISSIEAYQTYGIQPSKLRFIVNNLFYFPQEYLDCLSVYYLQEIETHEFLNHIKEGMFIQQPQYIEEDDIAYQIIYHKTDPTKLLRRQDHTTVKMSFRVAQPEFNILPTVLVKEVIGERE